MTADRSVRESRRTDSPVRRALRDRLAQRLGRDWAPGDRLPPIRELAQQLGASVGTVRLAVRDLVERGLLESSRRRGTFVSADLDPRRLERGQGPTPRPTGRRDSAEPLFGRRIAVIVPLWEVVDAFTEWAVQAVIDHVSQRGGSARMEHVRPYEGTNLAEMDADALVVVNPCTRPPITCQPLKPMVVMNTALETPLAMADGYDVVSVDQVQGGFLAGQCLRQAGCRSVAYLGVIHRDVDPPTYRITCATRLEGFRVGWADCGPIQCMYEQGYNLASGGRAVAEYLKFQPRPEAIFAASDELAVGFIVGALAHGLEAGLDYQIVGFDGQERGKHVTGGPLTTVEVPLAEMAQVAVRLLSRRVGQPDQTPQRIHIGARLFQGATVRPVASDTSQPAAQTPSDPRNLPGCEPDPSGAEPGDP